VTYGDFTDRNIKITSADKKRVQNLWVKNGDIFIERSNTPELVGTARLYPGEDNRAIFPDLLIRVRVNQEAAPRWVEICLQSHRLRRYFKSRAQGISGTMPKIDQQTIMDAEIPLPPISDQRRLISSVDRYLSIIKETEDEVDSNLKRANLLRQSILLKAFTGKLTN
jgi:type I restriction enzyme S subunit